MVFLNSSLEIPHYLGFFRLPLVLSCRDKVLEQTVGQMSVVRNKKKERLFSFLGILGSE